VFFFFFFFKKKLFNLKGFLGWKRLRLWLANSIDFKSNLAKLIMVKDIPSIKDESRPLHLVIDLLEVQCLEFIPFSNDSNRMSVFASFIYISFYLDIISNIGNTFSSIMILDISENLLLINLRIIHMKFSTSASK